MHVLVTVDCDDDTSLLVQTCKELTSKAMSNLTVLGITPDLGALGVFKTSSKAVQSAQRGLVEDVRAQATEICANVNGSHEVHLASGKIADEIIKAAVLHSVDCVMKAEDVDAAGKAIGTGQVAKTLIRKCPVPVWITSAKSKHPPRKICIAIDNVNNASNKSEATLLTLGLVRHAVTLAQRLGIDEITLVHAWSAAGLAFLDRPRARVAPADIEKYMQDCEASASDAMTQIIDLAQAQFANQGISFVPKMVMGLPHVAIPQAVKDEDADILVIGSANRSGIMGLLIGNTAEAILNALECSVFVVKPEGLDALIASQVQPAQANEVT